MHLPKNCHNYPCRSLFAATSKLLSHVPSAPMTSSRSNPIPINVEMASSLGGSGAGGCSKRGCCWFCCRPGITPCCRPGITPCCRPGIIPCCRLAMTRVLSPASIKGHRSILPTPQMKSGTSTLFRQNTPLHIICGDSAPMRDQSKTDFQLPPPVPREIAAQPS